MCKEDGAGKGKMAQGKIARRLASTRLNAVRCGGGMTPFSHHNVLGKGCFPLGVSSSWLRSFLCFFYFYVNR